MHLHGALRSEANCVIPGAPLRQQLLCIKCYQATSDKQAALEIFVTTSPFDAAFGATRLDVPANATARDAGRPTSTFAAGAETGTIGKRTGPSTPRMMRWRSPTLRENEAARGHAERIAFFVGFARPHAVLGGGFRMPRANDVGVFDARNRANREWRRMERRRRHRGGESAEPRNKAGTSSGCQTARCSRPRAGPRCARCAARSRGPTPAPFPAPSRAPRSRARRAAGARGPRGASPR